VGINVHAFHVTTEDIERQARHFKSVAQLLDEGIFEDFRISLIRTLYGFTVENLSTAHEMQDSGKSMVKSG